MYTQGLAFKMGIGNPNSGLFASVAKHFADLQLLLFSFAITISPGKEQGSWENLVQRLSSASPP